MKNLNSIIDKIEKHILSGGTYQRNRAIGIEIESIIYNRQGVRIPVESDKVFSSSDFVQMFDDQCKKENTFVICSLEPGGQVEWASNPQMNLHEIANEYKGIHTIVKKVCHDIGLKIVDLAIDPIYCPSDIKLINLKKYKQMNDQFVSSGRYGQWMMRNTASVQVNIDILNKQDAEECGFIADCISPFAAMLFSNSPFMGNKPVGVENMRYQIWEDTDPSRCGHFIDHGIDSVSNLLSKFCAYILEVPVIFTPPDLTEEVGYYQGTVGQWLKEIDEKNGVKFDDIKTALHQIFTHNRFKTVLELRSADRPPGGYELAPAAFWLGLMETGKIRETLLETLASWSVTDRRAMNVTAATWDFHQPGPENKSILFWLEWLAELVLESLDQRAQRLDIKSEGKYIESFINEVFSNGPFTQQRQHQYAKTNMTIRDFIMDRTFHGKP